MRISTRIRYGMRALLELGLHYGEGPMLIRDISAQQNISQYYLEQILIMLRTAGLVKSLRGARGGMVLARPPEKIKLEEALGALGGLAAPVDCVEDPSLCDRAGICAMHDIWAEIEQSTRGVLESKTLQTLVDMQLRKGTRIVSATNI